MAAGEVGNGAPEVPKTEMVMNSYDLSNVGGDCKLKVVNGNGNENVCHDPDGSYVFVSDTSEATADESISDKSFNVEAKPVMDSEVKNAEEVQFGEVVGNNGGDAQSSVVGDNHCVLLSADKEISLIGKPNGQIVDVATSGTVEHPSGAASEDHKNRQLLECTHRPKEIKDSHIDGKAEADGDLGESHVSEIMLLGDGDKLQESINKSPVVDDSSDTNVKLEEQNKQDPTVELKEIRESDIMSLEDSDSSDKSLNLMDQNDPKSNAELGDILESAIKSPKAGESDENKKLQGVVLGAGGRELPEVEVDGREAKFEVQLGLETVKELEESPEPQVRITRSADSVTNKLDNEEEKLEKMTDLNTDVEVKLANETDSLVTKRIVCCVPELNECIDGRQKITELNVTAENVAILHSPASITSGRDDGRGAELELAIAGNSENVLSQGNETGAPVDTENSCDLDSDENKGSQPEEHSECIDGSQKDAEPTGDPKNADTLPIKNCESFLASPDAGTVDQGLVVSDIVDSDLVQGNEAEKVAQNTDGPLMAETATVPISDQCKVSQIDECNIGGRPKSPELNVSSGNAEIAPTDCIIMDMKTKELPVEGDESFLASPDAGTVSDQGPAVADIVESVQGHEAEKVVQDTATGPISDQNNQIDDISGCPKDPELNLNRGNVDSTPSDCIITEVETRKLPDVRYGSLQFGSHDGIEREVDHVASPVTDNSVTLELQKLVKGKVRFEIHDSENNEAELISAADGTKSKTGVDIGLKGISTYPVPYLGPMEKIAFGTIDPAVISSIPRRDVQPKVSIGDAECTDKGHNQSLDNNLCPTINVTGGGRGDTNTRDKPTCQKTDVQPKVSIADTECTDKGHNQSLDNNLGPTINITAGGRGDSDTRDKPICQKTEDIPSLPEGSNANAADEHKLVVEGVTKPFQFLIRCPKFDDEKLQEQVRAAQLILDEKTWHRDRIRANFEVLHHKFEAAKSEERDCRRLIKLKRQEIDSVLVVINKVKNVTSVDDIDKSLYNMEYMLEHETVPLNEEKQMIRDIKQLKLLREELSSNLGTEDEVQQALAQRDHVEERLKILKKELNGLKENLSRSESAVSLARKKCDEESKRIQDPFKAASDLRQKAFKHLTDLKSQLNEKNKYFWMYKEDARAASECALSGDRQALYHLCVNQVETIMEQWNKNDEFRKDYVNCNMRSTVRRFKTLDGRSLGPDEEPPVLPQSNYVEERVDRHFSSSSLNAATSPSLILPPPKQEKPVPPGKVEVPDKGKSIKEVAQPKKQILISKPVAKLGTFSSNVETKVEENLQTKEELELARKAEALRKEEIAEKLKEQRRLEEKAKAQEALERKKRIAEKAQIKAELRAQKEAEQKEKERERRLRKKERKQSTPDDGQIAPSSELPPTESESKGSSSTVTTRRRQHKPSHYTKAIKPKVAALPPQLRNRGNKRLTELFWWIFGTIAILFIFYELLTPPRDGSPRPSAKKW